jgi:TPR repeat protein
MPAAVEDSYAVFTPFDRGLMAYQRKDFEAAREALARAGDDGRAWMLLGQLASEGGDRPEDPGLAATYYERAAQLSDANGAYCLGALYALGRGVTRDYAAAMRWYKQAEELGMPMGWRQIGIMHAVGQGTRVDLDAAEPWWLRAAAAGKPEAMGDLGQLYAYHRHDPVTATEWYKKAADAGLAGTGEHHLGHVHGGGARLDDHR